MTKRDLFAPFRARYAADNEANGGPKFWRSIEHKNQDASVIDAMDVEFTGGTGPLPEMQRREVLKLAGASLALGGLTACMRRPEEEILPYTHQPEEVIPGVPNFYATAMPRPDGALGLVAEAHEGRPTKLEGNPLHPSSLGAADVWAQAEVLRLYDPDRARNPMKDLRAGGSNATWADWDAFAPTHFAAYAASGGRGLAFVVDDSDRPTMARLFSLMQQKLPEAKLYRWDALSPDRAQQGAELAYGPGARVHHDLEKAKVVFALDSNFLVEGPEHLKKAKAFSKNRRIVSAADAGKMNRLYVAEGVFSSTGANADNRLRLPSSQGPVLLQALASALAQKGLDLGGIAGSGKAPAGSEAFLGALATDLANNRGSAVILVGERQPAAVHALAYAINAVLGETVQAVSQAAGAVARVSVSDSVQSLAADLAGGKIDTLVVFDVNLAKTTPAVLNLAELLGRAKTVVHAGLLPDETARCSSWHLPLAHFLEGWGDARGWDGTAAIVQPLVLPIFGARSEIEVLAQILGIGGTDRSLVEATWRGDSTSGGLLADNKAWRRALHDGVIASTAFAPAAVGVQAGAVQAAVETLPAAAAGFEIAFTTGSVLDGRLGNISWIQELPDTMTKLCWDNALVVSPVMARELGINSRVVRNSYESDVVTVSVGAQKVELPTFVLPGLDKATASVHLGFGKKLGGVAHGVGVDASSIQPADGTRVAFGAKIEKTGRTVNLCSTQDHFAVPASPMREPESFAAMTALPAGSVDRTLSQQNRALVRTGSLKLYQEKGGAYAHQGDIPENLVAHGTAQHHPSKPLQPISDVNYDGQQWGMVIDLTSCIGCNACVIACQAENNIPAVGREQVLFGRELHWLRIDRYFSGDVDNPEAQHQPMTCMHCELAPCEPVCPVAATVHDEEGVNSMAYNRCIGTRYCANNCPYKVRRFNYLDFTVTGNIYRNAEQDARHDIYKLQRNPNVTVRYRGVMEKCTYCTQRIEEAKINAKKAGGDRKALPDGAVTPACAQTCPTDAIVFGNINDEKSRVHAMKKVDRNYEVLQELNVRPRTTYLARIKNTNPELG